jgi:hypothetical protein
MYVLKNPAFWGKSFSENPSPGREKFVEDNSSDWD